MKYTFRGAGFVGLAAVITLLLGACGGGDASDPPVASATSDIPESERTHTESRSGDEARSVEDDSGASEEEGEAGEGELDYTDPSQAASFCDVMSDLVTLNDEAETQGEGAIVSQLGERLKLVADGAARAAELTGADSADAWSELSEAYSGVYDLYVSSGEQIANDAFLAELAEAVEVANGVYNDHADDVQSECGVDISVLSST